MYTYMQKLLCTNLHSYPDLLAPDPTLAGVPGLLPDPTRDGAPPEPPEPTRVGEPGLPADEVRTGVPVLPAGVTCDVQPHEITHTSTHTSAYTSTHTRTNTQTNTHAKHTHTLKHTHRREHTRTHTHRGIGPCPHGKTSTSSRFGDGHGERFGVWCHGHVRALRCSILAYLCRCQARNFVFVAEEHSFVCVFVCEWMC